MALIKSENTKPEIFVRKLAHAMGYRFRLHRRDLPGTPDIVFPSRRCAIFVNGCFWHRHSGCKLATLPKSGLDYWIPKFERTVARDEASIDALRRLGWRVLTLWECEIKSPDVEARLREFLDSGARNGR